MLRAWVRARLRVFLRSLQQPPRGSVQRQRPRPRQVPSASATPASRRGRVAAIRDSAATEHTESRPPASSAHASRSCREAPVLDRAATEQEKKEAQADRADTSMETLCSHVVEFLGYVVQETMIFDTELEDIICEKMVEWSYRNSTNAFYNEPALLLHKRMWDIMRRDKEGLAKERTFTHWCRRVHEHTKAASTASGSTAYESLAVDLLANDLTPEQRHDATCKKRYHTETGGIIITNKQRSWISHILRRNLGDAKVAYFIFDQGLPELLRTQRPYSIFCKRMKQRD